MKRKSDFLLPYPYPHPYEDSGPTGFGFELQEPTSAPICSYHSSGMPNVVNEPEVGLKMKTKKQMCMSMSMQIQMKNIQYQHMHMNPHFMAPVDAPHVPDDAMTLLSFSRNVQTNNAIPMNYTNTASTMTNMTSDPDPANSYHPVEDNCQSFKNINPNSINVQIYSGAPHSNESILSRYQDGEEKDDSNYQFAVEYAAGFIIRNTVLLPVLNNIIFNKDNHSETSKSEDVSMTASEKDGDNSKNEETISLDPNIYGNMCRKLTSFMEGKDILISLQEVMNTKQSESEENINQHRYERTQSNSETFFISSNVNICDSKDHTILSSWYDNGDKYLAYTSQAWSQWWKQKCCNPGPGCEMVKLVAPLHLFSGLMPKSLLSSSEFTRNDEVILGVAYYERSTTYYTSDNKNKNSKNQSKKNRRNTTLIYGMRINPLLNIEVRTRSQLYTKSNYFDHDEAHKDLRIYPHDILNCNEYAIMTALFTTILFKSLRCGTSCIGVKSVKSEYMEKIYYSYMGSPNSFHEIDGEKFFLLDKDSRFTFLRMQFEKQWKSQTSLKNQQFEKK